MDPKRLQAYGFVREIDEKQRRVRVVVSTGDVARDDAIIEQGGWVFDNYDRNPVVLWAHDDRSLPIARALPAEREVTDNELIEWHEFATHPAAENVWQSVRGGFVNATSVRWLPGETAIRKVGTRNVLVFTKGHEMLEESYVPVPADPGCLVTRADGHRIQFKDERGRITIDYSMRCAVKGCPNEGWDASIDICDFHLQYVQSGEPPMPADDNNTKSAASAAVRGGLLTPPEPQAQPLERLLEALGRANARTRGAA